MGSWGANHTHPEGWWESGKNNSRPQCRMKGAEADARKNESQNGSHAYSGPAASNERARRRRSMASRPPAASVLAVALSAGTLTTKAACHTKPRAGGATGVMLTSARLPTAGASMRATSARVAYSGARATRKKRDPIACLDGGDFKVGSGRRSVCCTRKGERGVAIVWGFRKTSSL